MRKVITIPEVTGEKKESKGVEFTHCFELGKGWSKDNLPEKDMYNKIVYLGNCKIDGDMFAAYGENSIDIYKGHLNDGTY